MYQELRFHVGDRISTKHSLVGLPAGSCGTILSVFVSVRGAYDVLFEADRMPRIAFQPDLTLIAPAAQTAMV